MSRGSRIGWGARWAAVSGLVPLALMVSGAPARADVNQLFGTLPRPMALGGAYTAAARDPAALYYNPAGLAAVDGTHVSLGFFFTAPNLSANLPSGADANLESPGERGYGLHLAWSPSQVLDGDLGLGFSVILPHRRALEFTVHDIDDPYFVFYENTIELLEIRLGAAYKFFDLVSIGASALLLAGLDGSVVLTTPFQDPNDLDQENRTRLSMTALLPNREFFTAGIQVYPMKGLTLGLNYREATFVPIQLPIDITLEIYLFPTTPIRTVANVDVKVKYTPAQLSFGAAYQVTDDLFVTADLAFARFSQYALPTGDVEFQLRTDLDFALLPPRAPKTSLRDLWIPRVGVEWMAMPELSLRGGYYFFRSFIRSVDTPILDSDKHNFSLGAGYDLGRLFLTSESEHLHLTGAAQMVVFTGRTTAEHAHSGQAFAFTFGAEFVY